MSRVRSRQRRTATHELLTATSQQGIVSVFMCWALTQRSLASSNWPALRPKVVQVEPLRKLLRG